MNVHRECDLSMSQLDQVIDGKADALIVVADHGRVTTSKLRRSCVEEGHRNVAARDRLHVHVRGHTAIPNQAVEAAIAHRVFGRIAEELWTEGYRISMPERALDKSVH